MRIGPACPGVTGTKLTSSYANDAFPFLSLLLSSFFPLAAGSGAAALFETTRQYNATVPPLTFAGSTVTMKGTYSLLPCALRKSSRTHANDRSLGGCACPADDIVYELDERLDLFLLRIVQLLVVLLLGDEPHRKDHGRC